MICQNCHASVDNDLVFCTDCGARLSVPVDSTRKLTVNETAGTGAAVSQPAARSNSSLKWAALIIALLALPASLGIVYLLLKNSDSSSEARNINKSPAAANKQNVTPVDKRPNAAAANSSVNNASSTAAAADANTNPNDEPKAAGVEIFNDEFEIVAGAHKAYSFTVNASSKITGELQTLRGEPVLGYVYFQNEYDEYFPDPTYKVFSIDGQNATVEQTLVKGDYVLIFLNQSKTSAIIKGKFKITPSPKAE